MEKIRDGETMTQKPVILTVVILVALVSSASAFNGKRKGFVLGAGVGFSPVSTSLSYSGSESEPGIGYDWGLGYAWNEHNMIVFEWNGTAHGSSSKSEETNIQLFEGLSWYHYFGRTGKSLFSGTGVGVYNAASSFTTPYGTHNSKWGALIGGGYEFAKHLQIAYYVSFGKTSTFSDYSHVHLNILLSAIAY